MWLGESEKGTNLESGTWRGGVLGARKLLGYKSLICSLVNYGVGEQSIDYGGGTSG